MTSPEIIRHPRAWQAHCREARAAGQRLSFVPTMGALHVGHEKLLEESRHRADVGGKRGLSLVSIFVNPTQFGPREDLSRYPRDLDGDRALCVRADVDCIFSPEPADMFPPGYQSFIDVGEVSKGLCGDRRPGHFRGVATVVAKLWNLTQPHVTLFGEKDYQQLQVVKTLARDLAFDLEVASVATVRETDGLAMSSRNRYLSPEERARAVVLSASLRVCQELVLRGERQVADLITRVRNRLEASQVRVDYVEVVHPETLRPIETAAPGSMMLIAGFVGTTRLIDNAVLP